MFKLIIFALIMVVGQLTFKRVALGMEHVSGFGPTLRHLALNPWFLAALSLYGTATLLWVLALREIPLSRAYVFVALAFALVPIGAAIFFNESLSLRYIFGLALVILGVLIIGTGSPALVDREEDARAAH